MAHAQTVDQTQYDSLLRQVIALLEQRVTILEQELAALTAQQSAPQITQPDQSSPSVGVGGSDFIDQATTTEDATSTQLQITLATTSDGVVINNTTGVTLRVQGINFPNGTIQHVALSDAPNLQYPVMFTDPKGNTDNLFDCRGAGSEGTFPVYGNGKADPCRRGSLGGAQSPIARNELQPGESMTLTVSGDSTWQYQAGSIVEADSGSDVIFE